MEIRQLSVTDGMIGVSVEELDIRRKYGLNIIAIEQGRTTYIGVSSQHRFHKDDNVTAIGRVENFKRFVAAMEK